MTKNVGAIGLWVIVRVAIATGVIAMTQPFGLLAQQLNASASQRQQQIATQESHDSRATPTTHDRDEDGPTIIDASKADKSVDPALITYAGSYHNLRRQLSKHVRTTDARCDRGALCDRSWPDCHCSPASEGQC